MSEVRLEIGARSVRSWDTDASGESPLVALEDVVELCRPIAHAAFVGCVRSDDPELRFAAVRSLGFLHRVQPDAAEDLLNELCDDPFRHIAAHAEWQRMLLQRQNNA